MGMENQTKQKNSPDYTTIVLRDMYEIMITHPNPWPKDFTKVQKLTFLDNMISYWTDVEDYEKCNALNIVRTSIMTKNPLL